MLLSFRLREMLPVGALLKTDVRSCFADEEILDVVEELAVPPLSRGLNAGVGGRISLDRIILFLEEVGGLRNLERIQDFLVVRRHVGGRNDMTPMVPRLDTMSALRSH